MKRSVWAALVCATVLAAVGCKKADKKTDEPGDTPAAKTDDKPASETAGAPAAPPPGAAALATTGTQDDFAALKLDTAPAAATEPPADAPKVDPTTISKDGIPTMQVHGFAGAEATGFRVSYAESSVPLHQQFAAILKEVQLFEKIATALNSTIKLPRTVDIQLVDCGTVNAFYDPNNARIIVCYDLMTYFAEMFKPVAKDNEELGNAILGATIFAFFHEAGHGLIHQLDLPATGREEDAVDQFATLILIAGGEQAVSMALAGAYWFQLQSQQNHETPFYDEHAFDGQRFYNILCWIYGSDGGRYGNFVSSGTLPEARAVRCGEEFGKMKRSWEKLLEPHLTDQAAENADIEQAPEPVVPAAKAHAIPCEQVADKVAQLVIAQLDEQYKEATQEQIDAIVEQLKVQIPQMTTQLVDECTQKDWTDQARSCVMNASTVDAASACGV
jgi:hypothetical protein